MEHRTWEIGQDQAGSPEAIPILCLVFISGTKVGSFSLVNAGSGISSDHSTVGSGISS